MFTELVLTHEPIVPPPPRVETENCSVGAVITFWGIVRGTEGGTSIAALEYTAFEAMARHQFEILFRSAAERWPIVSLRLIHRLGRVPSGEASLWVEVASPHRAEAFAACQWLIDQMKQVVPIWKQPIRRG